MPDLSRPAIEDLVRQALAVRVRVLLGQCGFDELMATQERVSQALAEAAVQWHGDPEGEGAQAMAQAVIDGLGLDALYYQGSALDHLISEGLSSAGLALAEAIRGHEQDSRARWQAEVVPRLERIATFVAQVLDGRWAQGPRLALSEELAQAQAG